MIVINSIRARRSGAGPSAAVGAITLFLLGNLALAAADLLLVSRGATVATVTATGSLAMTALVALFAAIRIRSAT